MVCASHGFVFQSRGAMIVENVLHGRTPVLGFVPLALLGHGIIPVTRGGMLFDTLQAFVNSDLLGGGSD